MVFEFIFWVVLLLLDVLLGIFYYPTTWLLYKACWRRAPKIVGGDATTSEATPISRKTVVIVGANFAGLNCLRQLAYNPAVRVLLIDQRDYFEYTPGVLRLFCKPALFRSMASPLPGGSHEFLLGKVTAVNSDHVMVSCASGTQRVGFDCLVWATGADYRQPITAGAGDSSMAAREATWRAEAGRLEKAASVLVLGGGAIGVELAAEVRDHFPEKRVTLVQGASALVPQFPPKTSQHAEEWCRGNGVELLLSTRVKESDDTSATLQSGEVLKADVVYSCLGMRANSSPIANGDLAGSLSPSGQVRVNRHLQVLEHPHIFAAGDVMTNPTGELKQAFYADLNGEMVGENVLLFLKGKPLHQFPQDVVGADWAPLIYIVSLGQSDGSLGFNTWVTNGAFAALVKWMLEWLKVRQMENRPIGLLGFAVGDWLISFLSRKCFSPPASAAETG